MFITGADGWVKFINQLVCPVVKNSKPIEKRFPCVLVLQVSVIVFHVDERCRVLPKINHLCAKKLIN